MKNTTYDKLKSIALFVVPVLAFAASMLSIWDVPYQEQLTQTLTAIDVLIGACVGIAKKQWEDKYGV